MGYKTTVITDNGRALMQRVIAGETTMTFTKVALSEKGISEFEPKMETIVTREKDDEYGLKVNAIFENNSVTENFYINVIGIYAEDREGNTTLFSYSENESEPSEVVKYDGVSPIEYDFIIHTGLTIDDGIVVEVNPEGLATKEEVNKRWFKRSVATRQELPPADGSHQAIDEIWYVKADNKRYYEEKTGETVYSYEDREFTSASEEPIASAEGQVYRNTTSGIFYRSIEHIKPLVEKEYVEEETLPIGGTYINGVLLVVGGEELYRANAVAVDNYDDLSSLFEVVEDITTAEKENGHYYLDSTTHKLYFYGQFSWVVLEVLTPDTLPEPSEDIVGKYYYVGGELKFGKITSASYEWMYIGGTIKNYNSSKVVTSKVPMIEEITIPHNTSLVGMDIKEGTTIFIY